MKKQGIKLTDSGNVLLQNFIGQQLSIIIMGTFSIVINKVFNITFFFSIPTAIGLFFLAEPLTMIFCGEKYLDSVITMKLLSVCIILLSFNSYLNNEKK